MNKRAYGQAMVALLGLGTADVALLNLWAAPGWLGESPVTDHRSATVPSARLPPPLRDAPIAAAPLQAATSRPSSAVIAASTPAAVIAPEPRTRERTATRVNILFYRGTWWVGPAGRRTLRGFVEQLVPGARIDVEGHADESGSSEINRRISARRAAVAAALLTSAGVDLARIEQRAFGETRATGTGLDRRVELIVRGGP